MESFKGTQTLQEIRGPHLKHFWPNETGKICAAGAHTNTFLPVPFLSPLSHTSVSDWEKPSPYPITRHSCSSASGRAGGGANTAFQ